MFGNFAKLDSPRRLVQFWQNFQTSLVLLIPNCTHNRMIAYTNRPTDCASFTSDTRLKLSTIKEMDVEDADKSDNNIRDTH